jgi:hypothetical protein
VLGGDGDGGARLPATKGGCKHGDSGPTQVPAFLGRHGNQEKTDRVNHGRLRSPDMADNSTLA